MLVLWLCVENIDDLVKTMQFFGGGGFWIQAVVVFSSPQERPIAFDRDSLEFLRRTSSFLFSLHLRPRLFYFRCCPYHRRFLFIPLLSGMVPLRRYHSTAIMKCWSRWLLQVSGGSIFLSTGSAHRILPWLIGRF